MMGDWTLFSNHGHVLVCLAQNHEARLRDVAAQVGITERAVQKIVRELQEAAFINITKHGRCNRYAINTRKNLRHSLESQCTVGRLLQSLTTSTAKQARTAEVLEPVRRQPTKKSKPVSVAVPESDAIPAVGPPPVSSAVEHAAEPVAEAVSKDTAAPEPAREEAVNSDKKAPEPAAKKEAPKAEKTADKKAGKKPKENDTKQQGSLF